MNMLKLQKALAQRGISMTLHCFEVDDETSLETEEPETETKFAVWLFDPTDPLTIMRSEEHDSLEPAIEEALALWDQAPIDTKGTETPAEPE